MKTNNIKKVIIISICLTILATVLTGCGDAKGNLTATVLPGNGNVMPIGGRIFYISEGDNGATYTFYDQNMNVLENQTTDGLSAAYYYEKSGDSQSDKFFVYATKLGKPEGSIVSCKGLRWGSGSNRSQANGTEIGTGKSNTEIVMGQFGAECCIVMNRSYDTVWNWLKNEINDEEIGGLNGCMDWYIPSKIEMETLFKFKPTGLEEVKYWSSTEDNANANRSYAYYFDARKVSKGTFFWFSGGKDATEECALVIRSF